MTVVGTDQRADPEEPPGERLERIIADSPGSVVSVPERTKTTPRILAAVALLVGIGALVAVGLIAVWNFVLTAAVRAAMSQWPGW